MRFVSGRARPLVLLGLWLLAGPGVAAELVLYAEPGFRGARIVLRDEVRALDRAADFNDRARSAEVRDGVWQVCVDADFGGPCATLEPGRYPRFDAVLDGRISSARPRFGPPPDIGELVLFDDTDLRGARRVFQRDDRNLDRSGFNDRAASILVRAGRWEVCRDADYGGGCLLLGPGEYRRLEPRWSRRISSVRLAGGTEGPGSRPPFGPPPLPGVSSCTAGAAGACAPCSVTCSDGRRAVCSPGSMGGSYGCVEPAVCRCSSRP